MNVSIVKNAPITAIKVPIGMITSKRAKELLAEVIAVVMFGLIVASANNFKGISKRSMA